MLRARVALVPSDNQGRTTDLGKTYDSASGERTVALFSSITGTIEGPDHSLI